MLVEVARGSARMCKLSTTKTNKLDQQPPYDDGDVPDDPPLLPIPPKPPGKCPQQRVGDAHAEHEGERSRCMKVGETRSSVEVHISGAAEVDDDTRKFPNELPNVSERLSVLPERKVAPYATLYT